MNIVRIILILIVIIVVSAAIVITTTSNIDTGTVTITDAETGEQKTSISVEVADTPQERYTGLSNHNSLQSGTGMLFVFRVEKNYSMVMRNMSFPLDMIFVDKSGNITNIEHAELPENTNQSRLVNYSGKSKYVIEVPYGFTTEQNINEQDIVEIDYDSDK